MLVVNTGSHKTFDDNVKTVEKLEDTTDTRQAKK
jgi:hypothetical protein